MLGYVYVLVTETEQTSDLIISFYNIDDLKPFIFCGIQIIYHGITPSPGVPQENGAL